MSVDRYGTAKRLAAALVVALCPLEMVERARAGYYDDFLSDHGDNIGVLVRELRALGQHSLAQRAMEGEFDSTREESDAWADSPEGRATIRELTGGPPP